MTHEEKKLLELDICARFPFGVYARLDDNDVRVIDIYYSGNNVFFNLVSEKTYVGVEADRIRPYLRSITSMTSEEVNEYEKLPIGQLFVWLNEHHFDYNNLIKKGLANEAPEWMYREVE